MILLDGGQEAHVEHAVGFIQHQDARPAPVSPAALRKSSARRPGVAIITCAPRRMACNWVCSFMPPTTTAARMPVPSAILRKPSLIWMASSRVGVRIRALMPGAAGCCGQPLEQRKQKGQRLARAGLRRYDQVAGRRARAEWLAACTGVGWTNPWRVRLFCKTGESESSEKVFICFLKTEIRSAN